MQKLELFDETFDPDRTESYELSIQVSLSGFSFCLKDLARNFFIGLGSCPFSLEVVTTDDWAGQVEFIAKNYPWISKNFKRVIFSFESPTFCIVPKTFFEPKKAKQLLELNHPVGQLDEVWFNNGYNEMVSIFNIPSPLISSWLKLQSKSKVIGYCDPPLQFHKLKEKKEDRLTLTISFTQKFAVVVLSKGNELLHCGSIDTPNENDTVYHMVNICKQLDINPNNVSVNTMGYSKQSDTLDSLIERFFDNVNPSSTLEQNHFSYLLNRYKGRFANLFNQSLCE